MGSVATGPGAYHSTGLTYKVGVNVIQGSRRLSFRQGKERNWPGRRKWMKVCIAGCTKMTIEV